MSRWLLPAGADRAARLLLVSRGLRGFCDGFIAVLLPAYLLALGFAKVDVGLISTATLAGSAVATIAVGVLANRFAARRMFMFAALLMAATGLGFAGLSALLPLLIVAFVGTLNPSSGDVSLFLPLEQSRLAGMATGDGRRANGTIRPLQPDRCRFGSGWASRSAVFEDHKKAAHLMYPVQGGISDVIVKTPLARIDHRRQCLCVHQPSQCAAACVNGYGSH